MSAKLPGQFLGAFAAGPEQFQRERCHVRPGRLVGDPGADIVKNATEHRDLIWMEDSGSRHDQSLTLYLGSNADWQWLTLRPLSTCGNYK